MLYALVVRSGVRGMHAYIIFSTLENVLGLIRGSGVPSIYLKLSARRWPLWL